MYPKIIVWPKLRWYKQVCFMFSWWKWSNIGRGCPEWSWSDHPWSCSEHGWTWVKLIRMIGLWGWSCLKQEAGHWWPPEVPSNPSCSVILCLLPLITTKAACHCKIKWSTCRWSWQLWRQWENKFKSWCLFLQLLSCMFMLGQKASFEKAFTVYFFLLVCKYFSCWQCPGVMLKENFYIWSLKCGEGALFSGFSVWRILHWHS